MASMLSYQLAPIAPPPPPPGSRRLHGHTGQRDCPRLGPGSTSAWRAQDSGEGLAGSSQLLACRSARVDCVQDPSTVAAMASQHSESIDDPPQEQGRPTMATVLNERLEGGGAQDRKRAQQGRSRLAQASYAQATGGACCRACVCLSVCV